MKSLLTIELWFRAFRRKTSITCLRSLLPLETRGNLFLFVWVLIWYDRLLKFLSNMCYCEGLPIPRNQKLILGKVIEKKSKFLIPIRVLENFVWWLIVCQHHKKKVQVEHNKEWISLAKFVKRHKASGDSLLPFFQYQLTFLYHLTMVTQLLHHQLYQSNSFRQIQKQCLTLRIATLDSWQLITSCSVWRMKSNNAIVVFYSLLHRLPGSLRAAFCDLLYSWLEDDLRSSETFSVKVCDFKLLKAKQFNSVQIRVVDVTYWCF